MHQGEGPLRGVSFRGGLSEAGSLEWVPGVQAPVGAWTVRCWHEHEC